MCTGNTVHCSWHISVQCILDSLHCIKITSFIAQYAHCVHYVCTCAVHKKDKLKQCHWCYGTSTQGNLYINTYFIIYQILDIFICIAAWIFLSDIILPRCRHGFVTDGRTLSVLNLFHLLWLSLNVHCFVLNSQLSSIFPQTQTQEK